MNDKTLLKLNILRQVLLLGMMVLVVYACVPSLLVRRAEEAADLVEQTVRHEGAITTGRALRQAQACRAAALRALAALRGAHRAQGTAQADDLRVEAEGAYEQMHQACTPAPEAGLSDGERDPAPDAGSGRGDRSRVDLRPALDAAPTGADRAPAAAPLPDGGGTP